MDSEDAQSDFDQFAGISTVLEGEYPRSRTDPWEDSPFAWILREASARRGKIGEQLVERWCLECGLQVWRPGDSDCDLVIDGVRVEVKFSTPWATGPFKFQQIRDQDYELVVCLGIAPFDVRMWAIPKRILLARPQGVGGQHGGADAQDTLWLTVRPGKEHVWLHKFGGTLSGGTAALREQIELLR